MPTDRIVSEKMRPIEKIRIEFIKNEPILTSNLLKTKTQNG